jgi:hypothetical protein
MAMPVAGAEQAGSPFWRREASPLEDTVADSYSTHTQDRANRDKNLVALSSVLAAVALAGTKRQGSG